MPFGRRIKFAILVMVSQLLLIALAIAWVVHMVLIAKNGAIYFIEENPWILWAEIGLTVLITLFATSIFAIELYRLGERRSSDDRRSAVDRRSSVDRRNSVDRRSGVDRRNGIARRQSIEATRAVEIKE